MLVYVGGCLSMWPRFKCDSRQHHVMASANTEHYCDLSVFLPTSLPQTHTHISDLGMLLEAKPVSRMSH